MDTSYNQDSTSGAVMEEGKKCPKCGGMMVFSPVTGMLSCPYCEYSEEIAAADVPSDGAQELDFLAAENTADCDWGMEQITLLCQSCGAESVYPASQLAEVCPYCGSNHLIEQPGRETMKPGGVVPFQITQQEASKKFASWMKGRWFAPNDAKYVKPDAFKGVYAPYWTFDANTTSEYSARYGKNRTVRTSDGKTRTETDWYDTSGMYTEFIDDALTPGTTRYDAIVLDRILPFKTKENSTYDPKYIAGYAAERYTVGLDAAWGHAKADIDSHLNSQVRDTVRKQYNADRVNITTLSTTYTNVTYKYLLLPIWLSAYRFKDKVYQFMVNGQTGKAGGKAPVSPIKVAIFLGVIAIILVAVYLIWGNGS